MADLERVFSDNDTIDEQFQNAPFVGEAGLIQTGANSRTKVGHVTENLSRRLSLGA
jgi:hypothetical protein